MPSTIAFLGASGGCGNATLRRAVEAGHTCIALCRTPSKLQAAFPSSPANLIIKSGDAHDQDAVAGCLTLPSDSTRLVDAVSFSIGGTLAMPSMTIPDPDVCKKAITTLLEALQTLRTKHAATGNPLLCAISTTGISKYGRDVPLVFLPMYHIMLAQPHADKKHMEDIITAAAERYVIVRPSLLTDAPKPNKPIRVGVEDPQQGVEEKEIGYTISRDDVGRWIFDHVISTLDGGKNEYEGKAVSITN